MPTETVRQQVAALRRRAEVRAAATEYRDPAVLSPEEAGRLLHELRVHQIELEMQNEELHRVQVELEGSRARYFDLYHLAPVGYLTLTEKGTILEANLRAAALLGMPHGTLVKRPLSRFILPEDSDVYYRYHRQLSQTGQPQACEVRLAPRRAGASSTWVRLEMVQAQDEEQDATVCRVILSDITERRAADEALREREERQRLILNHLSVGVVFADIAGTAFYLNPRFTELFGYTLAQLPTLAAWWSLAHPEPAYREQVIAEWNRRLGEALGAGGEIRPMEVVITCSDGTEKYVRVTAQVIGDLLFVTFTDLTDRKAAEDIVRASESRYRDLYQNAPVAYFSVGPDARIRRCNRQAAKMLGYTIEQLEGRQVFDLYADTPHGKPKASQVFQRFLAGERVAGEELQMIKADGTPIWISLSVTGVLDLAGKVVESRSTVIDITERKEVEILLEARVQERTRDLQAEIVERAAVQAALQRSQASLAKAERMAHLGSWEVDLATDELRRIYGFRLEAGPVSIADLDNAIHPDDCTAVKAARQRALQSDQSYSNEYRIVLPGGETRVVHVSGEIHRDATGQPTHVFGMAQDITERARIMTELNQRVQELTSLQELGHVVSLALPLEEVTRTYLERLVNLTGLDLAQVFLLREGRLHPAGVCTHLAGPAAQERVLDVGECLCGQAVQDGRTVYAGEVDCDPRCTRSHCHAIGLHTVAALPLRSGEAIIGALALGAVAQDAFAGRLMFLEMAADLIAGRLQNALLHQDIQARAAGLEETVIERTRELQTERDRTQAILETVGESVIVTDLDGQILFLNPATEILTGFSRDETLGLPLWRNWSPHALKDTWPQAQKALCSGEPWRGEVAGYRKDGTLYAIALTETPLSDERTAPLVTGGVWVQRDITLLKQAERLKDQFVSNVSHELRTPISIIALSCDNLEAYHNRLDESQRGQILQDIHEQAHVLSGLVEDMLKLSQIDSGHLPEQRSQVDLARLVREETARQQPFAEKRSQHLAVTAAHPVTALGNEAQLRQVVRNLLDNAIKYTPAGGQICCSCEIRPSARAFTPEAGRSLAEAWAVVEVTDNGIGIGAKDLPFVFERFYRASDEGDVPGTGLGLPIAQELAQLHGGWIDGTSIPGQGSTFTVYLPLAGEEAGNVECGM